MRDRLTTKDALVFIALSQRDLMGLYWKIWEPMMMSGAMAFQYLLDWIEHRTGQAALPHPALGQDLTPSPTTGRGLVPSDERARSARRGARVDSSCPCVV